MKRLYKTVSAAIVSGTLLLCAAGCGRADRDEIEAELSKHRADTEAEVQTDDDAAAQEEIPEHVSYTVQGENSGRTMSVEADVVSTGLKDVSIYERTKVVVDDDWLRAFAEELFDDGEYEVVKPYEICSMEELLAEQEYLAGLTENLEHVQPELWMVQDNALPYYISIYDEARVKEMPEGTLIYEKNSINRMDNNGNPMLVRECRLRGNVNGERWELHFTEDCLVYSLEIPADYYTLQAYPIEPLRYQWGGVSQDSKLNNLCDYESAKREADELVNALGYEEMEVSQWSQTYCNDSIDNLDGYQFLYVISLSDVKSVSQKSSLDQRGYTIMAYNGKLTGDCAANQIYVSVGVMSEGIGKIECGQVFITGEKLTDRPQMLSFTRVDDAAKSYMNERLNAEKTFTYWGTEVEYVIDRIELSYVTVLYENNQYALVPIWVYYGSPNSYSAVKSTPVFGVTAVDGCAIEFMSGSVGAY